MKIKLETERFFLREVDFCDENGMFELDSNPEVHKYLGNKPVTNIDQIRDYINNLKQQYLENGIARWAVIDKKTNEFIGWSGIKLIKEPINNRTDFYEIGYRLKEKHWGKGIATETTIALIKYSFENLQTDKIYGICDINNSGSKNVLLKSGLILIESFDYDSVEHFWFEIAKSDIKIEFI